MSLAVDSQYKQYGTLTVPLFSLTFCYTVSTNYKYRFYQGNYKYLCTLNINRLSLNISIKYCSHNSEIGCHCFHFYVTSRSGCCWRCIIQS